MEDGLPRAPLRTVAVASLVAGAVHAAVFAAHVREWWAHGVFFLVVTLAQVVFGVALLTNAIQPEYFGSGYRRALGRLFAAGVVGNALVLFVYVWSRTIGVPLGPERGEVEQVEILGVLAFIAEVIVVVGSLGLYGRLKQAEAG